MLLSFLVDPQIEVRNQVVGAPVGTEIILKCSIQASPKPMMFWMRKDGSMIVPSIKYNISDQSISDYQFVSTLHIKSLNKDDFAQYVCVAKNTIGKSEELIKIYGNIFFKCNLTALIHGTYIIGAVLKHTFHMVVSTKPPKSSTIVETIM